MRSQIDLEQIDQNLLSYLIRQKRTEKGLTQKDLRDKNLSESTISNIEKQEAKVKQDKVFHLLEKLGILKEDIPYLINQLKDEIEKLKYYFQLIETLIDDGKIEEATIQLERYSLDEFHPLSPFVYYLKGRILFQQKEWEKAKKQFEIAIDNHIKFGIEPIDNLISVCYNELSSCSYHQNNQNQAIRYVEKGLSYYDENSKRTEIVYALLGNKIVYLEKSGQSDQSVQLMNEVWPNLALIESTEIKLNLFKSRVIALRRGKQYQEAIECGKDGLYLARRDHQYHRYYDLLIVIGSVHLLQKNFDVAYESFQTVFRMDEEMEYPRRHLDAHTYLAILHNYQKNLTESKQHLEKAIEIGQQSNDVYRLAKALIVYGNYYSNSQLFNEAIPYYEHAIKIAKEHNYKYRQCSALFKVLECHDKLSNDKDYIKYSKELLYLQKEMNFSGEDDVYEI
jgi:tetratricopeptide (TPR) repeat protein